MVHLIVKIRIYGTVECQACIAVDGGASETKCAICRKNVLTVFKCPHCHRTARYNGYDTICICGSCQTLFPDFEQIKASPKARIEYHLDKELK